MNKETFNNSSSDIDEEKWQEEAKKYVEDEETREETPLDKFFADDGDAWIDEATREHQHDQEIAKRQKQGNLTDQEHQTLQDIQKRGELFSFGLDQSLIEMAFNEELSPIVKRFLVGVNSFQESLVSALKRRGLIQNDEEFANWLNELNEQSPRNNKDLYHHQIKEADKRKKEPAAGESLRRLKNIVKALEAGVEESVAARESNFMARLGTLSHRVMRLIFAKGYLEDNDQRESARQKIEKLWEQMICLTENPQKFIKNYDLVQTSFSRLEQAMEDLLGENLPCFLSQQSKNELNNPDLFDSRQYQGNFSDILHSGDAWHKYLTCLTLMSWASVVVGFLNREGPFKDSEKLLYEVRAQADKFLGNRKIDLVVAKFEKTKKPSSELSNLHIGRIISRADQIDVYDFKFLSLHEPGENARAIDLKNMRDYFLRLIMAYCAAQKKQGPKQFGQLPRIEKKINCRIVYVSPFAKPHSAQAEQAPFALEGKKAQEIKTDLIRLVKQTNNAQEIADLDWLVKNVVRQLQAKKPLKQEKTNKLSSSQEFLKYFALFGEID